jgi:hypothetical protein
VTIAEALIPGAACLPCLTTKTGFPEAQIVASLRRLGSSVVVTVGPCSTCGDDEHRLISALPED